MVVEALNISLQFHCCGVDGPDDFARIDGPKTIPWSCCGKSENSTCTRDESYSQGCSNEIMKMLSYAGSILGGVAIGIAVVEVSVVSHSGI